MENNEMPPLMDFLRSIRTNKPPPQWFKQRLKQEYRDLEPEHPDQNVTVDASTTTPNDADDSNESKLLATMDKEDIDVQMLTEMPPEMPPIMDLLQRKRTIKAPPNKFKLRLKQGYRDLEPDHPNQIVNVDASKTTSNDAEDSYEAKRLATMDEEDIDVEMLAENELEKYQEKNQMDRQRISLSADGSSSVSTHSSIGYTRTTVSHSGSGSDARTTTIVTNSNYNDSDDNERNESEWDDDDDDDDDDETTIDVPAIESSQNSKTRTNTKATTSWSISLNDDQDNINVRDVVRTSPSQSKPLETPSQNSIYYEWDEESKVMKPLLLIPTTKLTKADVDKMAPHDLDEILDTERDEEYNTTPENLSEEEKGFLNMLREDYESDEDEDEDEDDDNGGMMNSYELRNSMQERFAPKKLENWWDRDDNLSEQAKRKSKLQTLRQAQENPLHKRCKTCPICKRTCTGHKSMLDHVLNKNNCLKQLDETLKEQLTAQKLELRTKKKKKKKTTNYDSDF
jgi:hypothetical protein